MRITSGSPKHKQLMEAGGVSKLHLAVFQGKQDKVRGWAPGVGDLGDRRVLVPVQNLFGAFRLAIMFAGSDSVEQDLG